MRNLVSSQVLRIRRKEEKIFLRKSVVRKDKMMDEVILAISKHATA